MLKITLLVLTFFCFMIRYFFGKKLTIYYMTVDRGGFEGVSHDRDLGLGGGDVRLKRPVAQIVFPHVAEAKQAAGSEGEVEVETLSFRNAALIVIDRFEAVAASIAQARNSGDGSIEAIDRRVVNPLPDKVSIIFTTVIGALNAALAQGKMDNARGILQALVAYADPYDEDLPDDPNDPNAPARNVH